MFVCCFSGLHQGKKENELFEVNCHYIALIQTFGVLYFRLWDLSYGYFWNTEGGMFQWKQKIPLHLKGFLLIVRHLNHVYKHGKTNVQTTSEIVSLHSQVDLSLNSPCGWNQSIEQTLFWYGFEDVNSF